MRFPKFSELNQNIKDELDLNEETFIQPQELIDYFNEAVDMIEGTIHTLYEDYFLTKAQLNVVAGASYLTLPSNIYANKIRRIFYIKNDQEKYPLKRVKTLDELLDVQAQDDYRFMITNSEGTNLEEPSYTIEVFPNFRDNVTNGVTIYFIRNAKRYIDENSYCDIPEFSNVIKQYVRYKCHLKEGHPDMLEDKETLGLLQKQMVETLRDKYVDEQNEVQKDFSFYRDFDVSGYYNF